MPQVDMYNVLQHDYDAYPNINDLCLPDISLVVVAHEMMILLMTDIRLAYFVKSVHFSSNFAQ